MAQRKITEQIIKSGIKTTLKMDLRSEGINTGMRIKTTAINNLNLGARREWLAISTKVEKPPINIQSVDISKIAKEATISFINNFNQAQKEKQERAEEMIGNVTRDVYQKIQNSSKEEIEKLKENLSSSHDTYKQNQKEIKNLKKTAEFIQKALGPSITEVLSSKIDPKQLENFCKILNTSGKIAKQAVPALRVLNNLLLAYDAVKILYPNETQMIKDYITNSLDMRKNTIKENTILKNNSLKERLQEYKKSDNDKLIQTTENQESNINKP